MLSGQHYPDAARAHWVYGDRQGAHPAYAFKQVSEDLFDTLINELECMLHLQHPGIMAVGASFWWRLPVGRCVFTGGDLEQVVDRPEGLGHL
jgi:hypothetical protein